MKRAKARIRELTLAMRKLLQPVAPEGGFNMADGSDTRVAMIDWLWAGEYEDAVTEMVRSNSALSDRLRANTRNTAYSVSAQREWRGDRRLNYLTGLLIRNRNVNVIPKDQVLLALNSKLRGMNEDVWEDFTLLRAIPSINWTDDLVTAALERDPGPPYECVQQVTVC